MNGRLLVVGDALLDRDLIGTVERLSPEAPVPVVDSPREHLRPGGAALAAYLAARRGADVTLVAPIGADPASQCLRALLEVHLDLVALPLDGPMPEKVRVRTEQHALLRLDLGGQSRAAETHTDLEALTGIRADAVLVSDYGRGTVARPWIRSFLAQRAENVPLVWDPHPKGPAPVAGTRIATPNLTEALHAAHPVVTAGENLGDGNVLSLAAGCASVLTRHWSSTAVAVTMGRLGALLDLGEDIPLIVPGTAHPEADACGAGDAFAASVALELGAGALPSEAVTAAVSHAGAHVAAGGAAGLGTAPAGEASAGRPKAGERKHAAQVTDSRVRIPFTTLSGKAARTPGHMASWSPTPPRRAEDVVAATRATGGTVVATGGCFDILHVGHIAMLRAARVLGDCLVVCLNSDASIRRLKGRDRPVNGCADRRALLEALESVDAVTVFDEDTPETPLTALRPDIWVKGGDYTASELPEAHLLASWGGQTLTVPYVPGRSTTRLIELAHESGFTGSST
ncbi:bifunctional heptose 7-phosphate kinase/heptose 1-phosphate adenyltransferase [Actinomadura sp. KC345]|uniref:PfkB family carbohydrate kinase n=1 Tax=Actinomadura sp. KC345 TaxID=2530371 RepID=UPI001048B661|nr:PfkB family carbohydrate kinase [Actinomadura sp. KC345]TDC50219.1 bifunctional heptose 7-phosphate kinase/heptose 1-phosphate adenyltransferase [Actinomadura sp. KC345]